MTTSKKTTKFVIELEGVELPEDVQSEISKELNGLFMKKIANLDFYRKELVKSNAVSLGIIDLINGGRLRILDSIARSKIFDIIAQGNIEIDRPNIRGLGVAINTRM